MPEVVVVSLNGTCGLSWLDIGGGRGTVGGDLLAARCLRRRSRIAARLSFFRCSASAASSSILPG